MQIHRIILLAALTALTTAATAQKTENVHGVFAYTVGENEKFSLTELKHKCLIGAQNEAIKNTFKERISSTTNMVDASINGHDVSSFYDEVTLSSTAEWIGDTQAPVFTINYIGGQLTFQAEVWGEAREISNAKTELDWATLCNGTTAAYQSTSFKHRDHLYIRLRTPVSGYVAIYLLDSSSKQACCMLPYTSNTTGQHAVKAGREYVFFDKERDPEATPLTLTTRDELEIDQVILIFSPNPFTKNVDDGSRRRQLGRQSLEDFEKWLRKLRKQDPEMVIDRSTWLTITKN